MLLLRKWQKWKRLERKPHDKVSITPSVSLFLLVCDDPFPAQRDGEQLVTDLSSAFWSHWRASSQNCIVREKSVCCHLYRDSSAELEKATAPHSSTLAWKIPQTEEPGRLQSMGSRRVRHDWATSLSLFTFMHWRRKWQHTPVFLPGESQGQGSLMGCLFGVAQSCTWLKRLSSSSSLYWVTINPPWNRRLPCLFQLQGHCGQVLDAVWRPPLARYSDRSFSSVHRANSTHLVSG